MFNFYISVATVFSRMAVQRECCSCSASGVLGTLSGIPVGVKWHLCTVFAEVSVKGLAHS